MSTKTASKTRGLRTAVQQVALPHKLTPAALTALCLCQEEFLDKLSVHLVSNVTTKTSKTSRVEVEHVQAALEAMGQRELWNEAKDLLETLNKKDSAKRTRHDTKKRLAWSQEQLEEQERLLAAAKLKMTDRS